MVFVREFFKSNKYLSVSVDEFVSNVCEESWKLRNIFASVKKSTVSYLLLLSCNRNVYVLQPKACMRLKFLHFLQVTCDILEKIYMSCEMKLWDCNVTTVEVSRIVQVSSTTNQLKIGYGASKPVICETWTWSWNYTTEYVMCNETHTLRHFISRRFTCFVLLFRWTLQTVHFKTVMYTRAVR